MNFNYLLDFETPIEVERLETTPYGSLRKPCTCFLWGPRICVFFVTSMGSPYVKRCLPHHGQRHSRRCFLAKVWKVFAILQATWELRSNEHDCCIGFSLDPPVLVPMAHVGNVRPGGGALCFWNSNVLNAAQKILNERFQKESFGRVLYC